MGTFFEAAFEDVVAVLVDEDDGEDEEAEDGAAGGEEEAGGRGEEAGGRGEEEEGGFGCFFGFSVRVLKDETVREWNLGLAFLSSSLFFLSLSLRDFLAIVRNFFL